MKTFITIKKLFIGVAILVAMCFLTCSDLPNDVGFDLDKLYAQLPETPTNVNATAISTNSINVSWNAATNAVSYTVFYRRANTWDSFWTACNNTLSTNCDVTGLSSSTAYSFYVVAYNNLGSSGQSATASETTLSPPPVPSTPSGVTAVSASSSSITISWSAVEWATGYYVYRSLSPTESFTQVANVTTTSWTNTELAEQTTFYFYRVAAYNSTGMGSQSNVVWARTLNPDIIYGSVTDSRDNRTYRTVTIGTQVWMAEDVGSFVWNRAMTACPAGWHLPTEEEWMVLVNFVGSNAGIKLRLSGTNEFGFSALPSANGGWWTATENGGAGSTQAVTIEIQYNSVSSNFDFKTRTHSVRCVRD